MPVDLEYIWRYLQFNESKKLVPVYPIVGFGTTHGVVRDTTGTSFFNIKWSHIQHNKKQHVKIYTLNDFTLQSKQKTFLNRQ